jgi:hypothetical protein
MKAPFCPNDPAHGRLYQLGTIVNDEWGPDDYWSCDYCPPGYNRFYRNERHACMVPTFESLDVRKELYGCESPLRSLESPCW